MRAVVVKSQVTINSMSRKTKAEASLEQLTGDLRPVL